MVHCKPWFCLVTITVCLFASAIARPAELPAEHRDRAEALIKATGSPGGVCVHLGVTDGLFTAALARDGQFVVHGLARDAANVEQARRRIQELWLYGPVSVDRDSFRRLPYADHLVNLLVIDDVPAAVEAGFDVEDAFRAVSPYGKICLAIPEAQVAEQLTDAGFVNVRSVDGWTIADRPRPEGMGDWTHARYGPEGTGTGSDRIAGPVRSLRWVYGPRICQNHGGGGSSIHAAVSANGRLYQVLNFAPPFKQVPDDHRLVARDAFSGVVLWERAVDPGSMRGARANYGFRRPGDAMAVSGDTLYTILDSDEPLVAIDGRTGEIIRTYEGTSPDATLIVDDKLLLLERNRIRLLNKEDGAEIWEAEVGRYRNTMFYGDGRVFAYLRRGSTIFCFDIEDGRELWSIEHRAVMQGYVNGTLVVLVGSEVQGLSAEDGSILWRHNYNRSGRASGEWAAMFPRGLVWVHDLGDRDDRPRGWVGLDPKTGEVKQALPVRFTDKCAPPRATEQYMIPGRLVITDIDTGKRIYSGAARAACAFGALPANGMLYTFPTDCHCDAYMHGTMGFGPEIGLPEDWDEAEVRFERGPAFGQIDGPEADRKDWPVYRAEPERTGSTESQPPADPVRLWTRDLGGELSPPTVAAGMAFVASPDRHQVHAVDASDGDLLWSFTAGARVTSPPTYYRGAVLFGSRDGWVYCVRAIDGELAWRYFAAPASRRIIDNGQPESAWPIEGSVLAVDGRVYGAAGRHSGLGVAAEAPPNAAIGHLGPGGGISVFALDIATGEPAWKAAPGNRIFADMLVREDELVYMQTEHFNLESGKPLASRRGRRGTPTFRAGSVSTFRQESYAPRAQWHLRTEGGLVRSPMMAFDAERVVGVQVYREAKYHVFNPEEDDYTLWLRGREADENEWELELPVRPTGMLLTPNRVYIAGPDAEWPHEGAWLFSYSADEGNDVRRIELEVEPVFDGLISAQDRLYMTTEDGKLICFGEDQ